MPKRQFLFCAVFGFRNPTHEIFSELDETKPRVLFFHGASRRPKRIRSGATGRQHHKAARPREARTAIWCGAPVPPPTLPFRLLKLSVAKTLLPRATIRKYFQRRSRRQSHLGGFRRSPPAPCQRGESSPGGLFITMIASGLMCE